MINYRISILYFISIMRSSIRHILYSLIRPIILQKPQKENSDLLQLYPPLASINTVDSKSPSLSPQLGTDIALVLHPLWFMGQFSQKLYQVSVGYENSDNHLSVAAELICFLCDLFIPWSNGKEKQLLVLIETCKSNTNSHQRIKSLSNLYLFLKGYRYNVCFLKYAINKTF